MPVGVTRCPLCYRPIRSSLHEFECSAQRNPPKAPKPPREQDQRGYVPPSRSDRVPRTEWLTQVRVTPEEKAAKRRARQARYRDKKRAEREAARKEAGG